MVSGVAGVGWRQGWLGLLTGDAGSLCPSGCECLRTAAKKARCKEETAPNSNTSNRASRAPTPSRLYP